MLRLFGPTLLTLSLIPSASLALGLGDIHVESALHQSLVAQIDLVDANNEDLARLSAGIANDEIFHRYNLERPAFLSGTTVVVGQDRQGHPALILRSSERFTEPVVTFLVALHSPVGQIIREYTVLLDPAGLALSPERVEPTPAMRVAGTEASAAAGEAAPKRAATTPDSAPQAHTYTVAPHDTLDRIARIAGAHSRSGRHRMMVAIFRANPAAFQTNFNALHSGAIVHFPTEEQLSAISTKDADREYEAQVAAWRASSHRHSPPLPVPVTGPTNPRTAAPVVSRSAPSPDTVASELDVAESSAPGAHGRIPFAPLAVAFGTVLAAAGAWLLRRRRNADNGPTQPQVAQQPPMTHLNEDQSVVAGNTATPLPQPAPSASLSGERARSEDPHPSPTTSPGESNWFRDSFSTPIDKLLEGELAGDTVEQKFSFTPENNTSTTHVIVGSVLEQSRPFVERRKSPADVLRQAIEREPHRTDLCLKLLELYYTAAAENRRAFVEATRQLAKNDEVATAADWSRIVAMGRAIAPEDELFADSMDTKAVA